MEFDQLKGFYHVARLGSFTAAAKRLYISQPAISLQVKALERSVGEKLFDRTGRKVKLTAAGEILFCEAEELVEKLEAVKRVVNDLKSVEEGRLSLGASDTVSLYLLPDLLKMYVRKYPKIHLRIVSLVSPEVVDGVRECDLDLGIVTLPSEDAKIEVRPIFEQSFVAVAPRMHRLAKKSFVSVPDLAEESLVLLERGSSTRRRIDSLFSSLGCATRVAMEFSNYEIIKRYVAAGLGVSLLPEGAVAARKDGVAVLPLRPRFPFTVGIAQRRERRPSHAAKAFLDMAEAHFRKPRARGTSPTSQN